jgi:hypothetical protein
MKKAILTHFLFIIIFLTGIQAQAQIAMPKPSPKSVITQEVGLTEVSIAYNRPSAKGRKIFGDLVPFDKVWRTGANMSTQITFKEQASIQGKKVPAGTYSMFSIPGKKEWTLILNKNAEVWGENKYNEKEDVLRFKVKPYSTAYTETFTISIGNIKTNSIDVALLWEKTGVMFTIDTEVDSKVMADIKAKVIDKESDNFYTYYNAATYYFDTNRDLEQALEWINKSIEMEPKFWTLHLKAKIQASLNDYQGAIATAERSKELAQKEKYDNYIALNDKLIHEWKKKK